MGVPQLTYDDKVPREIDDMPRERQDMRHRVQNTPREIDDMPCKNQNQRPTRRYNL